MRARKVVVLAVAISVAACASSKRSAPPATPSEAASSAGPTSSLTTTSLATTEATHPAATTTVPAATTSNEPVDQVRAAAIAYNQFYIGCLRDPRACDPAAGTVPESDAFRALTSTVMQLRAGGFYAGVEDPGMTAIESIEPMSDYTLVTQCHYTTMVLYGPPASEGGPPVVQNNTPGTVREALQFVQVADGSWRMRHGDTLLNKAGVNECPPSA